MMRKIRCLVIAAMLCGATALDTSPATASPSDVCAGQNLLQLSQPFGEPVLTKTTALFTFGSYFGSCVWPGGFGGSGVITGACEQSAGYGTTYSGEDFVFTIAGGEMVVTGELFGFFHVTLHPLVAGNNCLNTTASWFVMQGAVLKNPCVISDLGRTQSEIAGLLQTNAWLCV